MEDELVSSISQIEKNVRTFHEYSAGTEEEKKFYSETLAFSRNFVFSIVDSRVAIVNSKFVGYVENTMPTYISRKGLRSGGESDVAINRLMNGEPKESAALKGLYETLLDSFGKKPSSHEKSFWLSPGISLEEFDAGTIWPGENGGGTFVEGQARFFVGIAYERDPKARAECLSEKGYRCSVCGLSFEERYGEIGKGFIHVHHSKPLSKGGGQSRNVSSSDDLVPVCPNCHSMLHLRSPDPRSVEDLKNHLKRNAGVSADLLNQAPKV